MSKIFVIAAAGSIAGVVANIKNIALNDMIAVAAPKDMEAMSLELLTTIYNNATGETKGRFKIAKAAACDKVFAALEAMPVEKQIQLDKVEEKKIEAQAAVVATNGERKVRDSKLQRMAAAFRDMDDAGSFKQWTVKELMERCGTTEKITHQYISILRAPNDRFIMNIVKDKEAKTFQFQPKPAGRQASSVAQSAAA
jgi:hypothetical protein